MEKNENFDKAKEYWQKESKLVIKITNALMLNNRNKAKEIRIELKELKRTFKPFRKEIDLATEMAIKMKIPVSEL